MTPKMVINKKYNMMYIAPESIVFTMVSIISNSVMFIILELFQAHLIFYLYNHQTQPKNLCESVHNNVF